MDSMAERGMRFFDSHATSALYTPSRWGLRPGTVLLAFMSETSGTPRMPTSNMWPRTVVLTFPEADQTRRDPG